MQTYLAPKKRLIPLLVVCTIFLLVIPLALFLSPSHLLLVFDIFIPIIIVVFHVMWHCVPTNGRQMFLLNKLIIIADKRYFASKTSIRPKSNNVHPGLNVSARIVVSDKTLWQQVFKK